MDPIVTAAGTALIAAMATDAWQQVRSAVVRWWRQVNPDDAALVEEELARTRVEVLTARATGDVEMERALNGCWQFRLQHLLNVRQADEALIRRLFEEELSPRADTGRGGHSIVMKSHATDNARVYQAGRDQWISDPGR